ncbi:MAG TPA: sugar phosphate nucleotidyltransferase, partial [Vicinamibacteria bacterium]
MNPLHRKPNSLWSILLAGGEGERTRPFIERWLGRHKPKQYCTFVGTRSLFQHTVDRADRLSQAERRLVVAADSHREDVLSQMEGRVPGRILFQPENRGTAPGVFLPLTYVLAEDPEATVVVYPSDH